VASERRIPIRMKALRMGRRNAEQSGNWLQRGVVNRREGKRLPTRWRGCVGGTTPLREPWKRLRGEINLQGTQRTKPSRT